MTVSQLQPQALWNFFDSLNQIPRPSKKEDRVRNWVIGLGEQWGLDTLTDEVGNVLIKKPATAGMEGRKAIVLQSHLDMVCQKNNDTNFDFDQEGIKMIVDGDWVRADGTTLGADNGIGVAAILAILDSTDIPHPAIDALFTIDEETGMTGALGLKGGFLSGEILLNLDTEDDDELSIGCAGGVDVTSTSTYEMETIQVGVIQMNVQLKGGSGGHSGMDIHLGRGNANKLMNRILYCCSQDFDCRISSIQGGSLRNAIPRESFAEVTIPERDRPGFERYFQQVAATICAEYKTTDSSIHISAEPLPHKLEMVMNHDDQQELIAAIYGTPNGIYRMSPDIPDLVQTSNNLARVEISNGKYSAQCLTRSSIDSEKMDLAYGIESIWKITGAKVDFDGSYPGWAPNPSSEVVKMMADLYREMYQSEPLVNACHAGLECGIIGEHYPELDMVSFGPNIKGAHSPDEKTQISSVQKFWGFLQETLKRIPEKA